MNYDQTVVRAEASVLATNKVIKNTYILLSMTLIASAVMAALSMSINVGIGVSLAMSIGAMVLLMFVLPRFENSTGGIVIVFLVAGMLGFGLGPILNHYLKMSNGSEIIGTALGGTGVIFFALSAYALKTRKDFSFMAGFLMVGLIVVFGAIILNLFMNIPALALTISAVVILIMSALILYKTSEIIHGGETNYVSATVDLYLAIYNIFTSLLHILGALSGED